MVEDSSPMFGVGPTQFQVGAAVNPSLGVIGEYDPGISAEIDHAIRYMPGVVHYCFKKAQELKDSVGSPNFEVVLQHDPQWKRPRAFVAPANYEGIHEELTKGILLKAAMGMRGR